MKLFLFFLFTLFVSASHAEELFVPLSQFDNDSQRLTNNKVLEFWGYHNYDNNDNYQNVLKLRYYNPLEAGDWQGRIRLDTSYAPVTTRFLQPIMQGSIVPVTPWSLSGGRTKLF